MRKAEYEFSIGVRLTHWIRAIVIAFLIFSGFYISYVFIAPEISAEPTLFLNAKWRAAHQVAGFILIACFIFKVYLFIFDKHSRKELRSVFDFLNPKIWFSQIKYYLFLGKHPHLKGVYNPLQFASYFFFYVVLALICVSGLVLYAHVYHEGLGGAIYDIARWLEEMMGGLANVRTIHRICMWVIMIFVPIHVYMAVFNAVKGKNGAMDAIVSGYKFVKE
ncbi:Ni/Fe-hydrogenase, b-type cytochrome subunit [Campylobacter sp. RM9344]|uniref:Ni/Fe-hydrogenase, b-type cytochrome subunit n=1 Tax=Campylobacter californiensis TaxID=1032243 RepID=A0AAW3ZTV9_9BACT|nr:MULTISPECIES: Ni/Fe-hydrogenase, b-type cytochrome subunit [unclassified Campylobacter]MBE2984287.1 Ni/Fe-hydrogenase, b-type cytochrome subunit [Campylobacter sp. RM6883]MBE2985958.1 Ni/Fe-hydrogenase, b-type cytochrome subunit [Campylobacter sp. RM12919]MBE2988159.1 Ni/Fe-hydrogenase, b-type cytochrome subunit [Campylobacter sp. RM12920]MBE2994846.1 Ni/Fe-hydrogenase, b-type cytochrome subunit [Campylobacter sp. RM6913]MBE3029378.1 Ni/Fe-hydrogenase, b-type cytochrome subunit [Campylobact